MSPLRTAAIAAALVAVAACGKDGDRAAVTPAAAYVGSAACAACHAQQHGDWAASNHARAMQPATAANVLGDFADAQIEHAGVVTKFSRRGDSFWVATEGVDGAMSDFEVKWTFGVSPLQQYLVELDRGRLQALDIAWDAREKAQGGQRWILLHPDERVRPGDPLHWTGPNFEWNHMCAECHSTDVKKNFDADAMRYATAASEHGVGCEGCHGPGSAHAAWAQRGADRSVRGAGFAHALPKPGHFVLQPGAKNATRVDAVRETELETCARCHSRRTTTGESYEHGKPLLDTHRLALLDDPLYFADGQIRDEVFEHGSFLQSRMHRMGVVCSDCHDAHRGGLRAEGNALCARCHDAQHYDQSSHHHHAAGSKGAQCVECHMPERTYMVVDPRRDHSIRVPRPDLSVLHGTPNACTQCHADKAARWAADAVASWRGADAPPQPDHWAAAIAAGRSGSPRARQLLVAAVRRSEWPGIVRGTAARLLGAFDGDDGKRELAAALRDEDPVVRFGAASGLGDRSREERVALLAAVLLDPVANVRAEAAFALADCEDLLSAEAKQSFAAAAGEYESGQRANAERDWAWANLGLFAARRGDVTGAEQSYRRALRADAGSVRAAVNLTDLLREHGRDGEGERVLRDAIGAAWEQAPLQHALGLLLVRQGKKDEALKLLAAAASTGNASARHRYVFAVALAGEGRTDEALLQLEAAQRNEPWNRDVLEALVTFTAEARGAAIAIPWARRLVDLDPEDAEARARLLQLESSK